MTTTWISQLCRSVRAPETGTRYYNATVGILFVPLIQLLITPIQMAIEQQNISLPASILVMLLVSIMMLISGLVHGSVETFYMKRMKGPTDFLGRHMSFGFVASFVMLSKDHITNATDVPKIAGAFVVTSLISYIGSFLFAAGSFKLEECIRGLRRRNDDIENNSKREPSRYARRVSQVSQLTTILANNGSLSSLETACSPSVTVDFVVKTAPLWISLFLLCTIGLPVYCVTKYDMPFESFSFIAFWIAAVYFQRSLKACKTFELRPRLRSTLVVMFNPVLLTSALVTGFFWTKAAVTHQSIDEVLTAFRRGRQWADIVSGIIQDHNIQQHIGAGDLAQALLDAGIVSLGFKMFEYRHELWNSFTTVFSTSLVFAVINVFLNVVFAHAMGLESDEALAFAARNVTIALGVPAVDNIGGSTTLMSALVVFSGILFQLTGDAMFGWLGIRDRVVTVHVTAEKGNSSDDDDELEPSNAKVVAAGVTVGINAAAMGTAHLIERNSSATAYSALSMTVFGAITVALTAVPAISQLLQAIAAQ